MKLFKEKKMDNQKPEIIIDSKCKNTQYHMYRDKILVKDSDTTLCIELPRADKAVCFYNMYYVKDRIHVIVATKGVYDIRYILDEEKFELRGR